MSTLIKTAVIGHPINHSKSPLIHNHWINTYGLSGTYEAINIAPENLKKHVQRLIEEGYVGCNVTVPHKEAILKYCDTIDQNAKTIGAVNTVVIKDGKLQGFNTDGFGFTQNILQSHPDFNFQNKSAIVLGAGGAARAIINALNTENIGKIILINRTHKKAETIQSEMQNIEVWDWDNRSDVLKTADLLINTTSLGMNGQPALDMNLKALPKTTLVNDIVYAPLQTPLLKAANAQGCKTVTGIGMLLHQARPAFQHWFGILPDVSDELKKLVLK